MTNLVIQRERLRLEVDKLRRAEESLNQALFDTRVKLTNSCLELNSLLIDETARNAQIVESSWAKNFKDQNPNQYLEALEYVMHPAFTVCVYLSDQLEKPVWALEALIDGKTSEFWLGACNSKEEALKLCEDMQWRYLL